MTLFFSQFERQWQAALGGVQAFPAPGVRVVQQGIVLPLQKRGDCDPALNCYQGGVTDSAFGFVAGLERKKRCSAVQPLLQEKLHRRGRGRAAGKSGVWRHHIRPFWA